MIKSLPQNQQGAALVISLIILISMTLIGIASMKASTTELTMAGNLRQASITFQAAEAGLRDAEKQLTINPLSIPDYVIAENAEEPDYFAHATWQKQSRTSKANLKDMHLAANPAYIIKNLGVWNPDAGVSEIDPGYSGYGQTSSEIKIEYFRISARGYGATVNTFRTVQSFYGRKAQ